MKYGLIGEKLGHSFSKEIHEMLGYYKYEIHEVAKSDIDSFMKQHDFLGINVTIPYKETVIPYLDEISAQAASIKAVNTIVNINGKLIGHNTDYFGMLALIKRNKLDVNNKKVLILGTGGTSKTAYAVLSDLGARQILKASIIDEPGTITYEEANTIHNDVDIIINTTPVGMYPKNDGQIIDLDNFKNVIGVIDVVYNPLRTNLVLQAKTKNLISEGGLYMLVGQAVYAAGIFLNKEIDLNIIDEIYEKIKNDKENIVLIGMPSSGKSTIGKILSEQLNKKLIDTDELIVNKLNMSIAEYMKTHSEKEFRDIETECVKEAAKMSNVVVATGGGAILRTENVNALKQNGKLYFLKRNLELLTPTESRPFSSDMEALKKRYTERLPIYESVCDVVIDNNNEISDAVKQILGE
ncbi:MAG: shikimate dehydrogenase [Bacilli bacterium]|nr:shikimate dehydrogenase [Bacilli bacterium]